mgnify:CR=1 FL=1
MSDKIVFEGREPLRVFGARTHNLKNVDVAIPRNKVTVITGPSGSGKSSLAFDTIFVEGQRQYMESLSTYSLQYLRRLTRPTVERVTGLQPTIALDQRTGEPNPRSSVATITEIFDYLRALYSRVGIAHCYKCGRPIHRQSVEQILQSISSLPEGTRFMLLAPVVRERRGAHQDVFRRLLKSGFTRVRVDGALVKIDDSPPVLDPKKAHTIEAVIDRLIRREGAEARLLESLKLTLRQSDGLACCLYEKERQKTEQGTTRSVWRDVLFSTKYSCPKCGVSYAELEPRTFSFNSPYGACQACQGIGRVDAFDPQLLVSDPSLSLETGALALGKGLSTSTQRKLTLLLDNFKRIKPEQYSQPLSAWDEQTTRLFFFGGTTQEAELEEDVESDCFFENEEEQNDRTLETLPDSEDFKMRSDESPRGDQNSSSEPEKLDSTKDSERLENIQSKSYQREKETLDEVDVSEADVSAFTGLTSLLAKAYAETKSVREREYLEGFRGQIVCCDCNGDRIRPEARSVTVGDKSLSETLRMTVAEATEWFKQVEFDELKQDVAKKLIDPIIDRLETMKLLCLDYLTLDRSTDSLSGGELQRVRLTTALGNSLSGVCYVLDEPSAGLHPSDIDRLLNVVRSLQEKGNTIILVEHNEKIIRSSDWMIDIGPGAGVFGGEVLATGTPEHIERVGESPTGLYLSGKRAIGVPEKRRKAAKTRSITLEGVQTNNLKDVSVTLPLGLFVCVTGVSGSGKSSLINKTLVPALRKRLGNSSVGNLSDKERKLKSIRGASRIDKLVVVDQSPLGRSPRSNPSTYSGIFDEIRKLFASSLEAKRRGYKAGRFSFNIAGGRCEGCQGLGVHRVESSVLPEMYVPCPDCEGKRFNKATLDVKYNGKTISEVLETSFDDAKEFFANHATLSRYIESFQQVGLGYLSLGQSATSLSGGEAQRVKLATELASVETGNTLYVLDEPTVGLHPQDVEKLLDILNHLVDAGNTVVVIEHSVDVMKVADWIIDLGPEGGVGGGEILAAGLPEDIAQLEDNSTARYLKEALKG